MVAAYTGWNDSRNTGSQAVIYGDDSTIDNNFIKDADDIMNEINVSFKWKDGDLLLLDNRTVMHSRKPFVGPRRILASVLNHSSR